MSLCRSVGRPRAAQKRRGGSGAAPPIAPRSEEVEIDGSIPRALRAPRCRLSYTTGRHESHHLFVSELLSPPPVFASQHCASPATYTAKAKACCSTRPRPETGRFTQAGIAARAGPPAGAYGFPIVKRDGGASALRSTKGSSRERSGDESVSPPIFRSCSPCMLGPAQRKGTSGPAIRTRSAPTPRQCPNQTVSERDRRVRFAPAIP